MSDQKFAPNQLALFESEITFSKDGVRFDASKPVWKIANPVGAFSFNIGIFYDLVGSETANSIRKLLKYHIENDSASYSDAVYRHLLYLLKNQFPDGGVHTISSINIINYASSLRADQKYFVGTLGKFFKRWHELKLPGIDGSVEKYYREKKHKGNKKGEAVRNLNPETGPLTDLEVQAIVDSLRKGFAEKNISLEAYSIYILLIVLGCRTISIAALKCKDLSVVYTNDGQKQYLLKLPRAKQRTTLIRDVFKDKYLLPEFGMILEAQIRSSKKEYNERVGGDMNLDELPIYPTFNNKARFSPGFELHRKPDSIYQLVLNTMALLNVISERTGEPIHIHPRRFRYTMGTRAAEEGLHALVIAEMLDHTDTQQVSVYVESTPEIARRIDAATALELAPIAQAFLGKLVRRESDAVRGDDLSSRIVDPDTGAVGTCGKYGFCGLLGPVACYTCHNFQPWLEADHEGLLHKLVAERERREERTGDARITNTLDRTILAVADVVNRCEVALDEEFLKNPTW